MKGGIVLILSLLSDLPESVRQKIRIVINDDEEIGSPHTKEVYLPQVKGVRGALVFEPGLPGGHVVTSHSGVYWIDLTVKGKAAHAGLEPQNGTSACVELGHKNHGNSQTDGS